jgi:hypothetical protein
MPRRPEKSIVGHSPAEAADPSSVTAIIQAAARAPTTREFNLDALRPLAVLARLLCRGGGHRRSRICYNGDLRQNDGSDRVILQQKILYV